jgi:ribonuclease E
LRLRDLAGLVVIDYIDMEVSRNIHAVERRLKEALRIDRARIQVGRISHFGLLEMSRQRLRPSVMESAGEVCPTCAGSGHVRSTEATALLVLRALEEEGINKPSARVILHVPTSVALYILNQKRAALAEIEARYDFAVTINVDDALVSPDYRLDRQSNAAGPATPNAVDGAASEDGDDTQSAPRKRRPRRRRSSLHEEADAQTTSVEAAGAEEVQPESAEPSEETPAVGESEGKSKRRRRGRRGGRRRSQKSTEATAQTVELSENMVEGSGGAEPAVAVDEPAPASPDEATLASTDETAPASTDETAPASPNEKAPVSLGEATPASPEAPEIPETPAIDSAPAAETKARKPRRRRAPRRKPAAESTPETATGQPAEPVADAPEIAKESVPEPAPAFNAPAEPAEPAADAPVPMAADAMSPPADERLKRGGWWQRITN